MLNSKQQVYLTIDWQEHDPLDSTEQRLWQRARQLCTLENYPQRLPCHNPACEEGGFEIGPKISAVLAATGQNYAQSTLIGLKAEHRSGSCLHTITYSITYVRPYQHRNPQLVPQVL